MIPEAYITAWSHHVPWATRRQVEQDLLLRRLVIEIARHPVLRDDLAFWGGTCLHVLHFARPYRYSEDLDFRRRKAGGLKPVFRALRDVAEEIGGLDVRTQVSEHPKALIRAPYEDGSGTMRVKIELNTRERVPAMAFVTREMGVESPWFSGSAPVATLPVAELLGTKIRALFERRKGRDLFDLWVGLALEGVAGAEIARCFETAYRPAGFTRERLNALLDERLATGEFLTDVESLVAGLPDAYEPAAAVALVRDAVLAHVASRRSQKTDPRGEDG